MSSTVLLLPSRVDQKRGSPYRFSHAVRACSTFALFVVTALSVPASAAPSTCEGCHAKALELASHKALVGKHADVACSSCHGGDSAASEVAAAHVPSGQNQLLPKIHTAASCVKCHLPGSVAGTEPLVLGARAYQDLGCPFCHNASGYGSPEAWSLPLARVGVRGPVHLKQMLNAPYDILPGTRMPSFSGKWKDQPAKETTLLTYLLTLRGEPRATGRLPAAEACSSCHGSGPTKRDRIQGHRCVELNDPKKELSCQRCHAKGPPVSDRECLYVRQRRLDCGVCHLGEKGTGEK